MIALTALRKLLQDNGTVASLATGGIHMIEVPQDSERPNVMLMTVSGQDDWSHDGPDGLFQHVVRIYSRGDTFQQAVQLADAVKDVLNAYVSATATYGVTFQLVQHINTTGDYQDAAKVFRQIDDYRAHYRLD